jgi:hypothetical protein
MRSRRIQRATETSQERNRGPVFRSGLKVLDNHDEPVMRSTRHDYLKGKPADSPHLPLRNKRSGAACTFALACRFAPAFLGSSRTRPASWSLATSVR